MSVENKNTVVSAFSEEHVEKLTGLTKSRLQNWDRTGFFTPEFADENRRTPFSRVYSFMDIVALRTLKVLRDQHNVSLQHLRNVATKLRYLDKTVWTSTKLFVLKRRVNFLNEQTEKVEDVLNGQYALGIPLEKIMADTERDIEKFLVRPDEKVGNIERHRRVVHNSWVVGGTRIPVSAIRNFHDAGYTIDEIIAEYPDLTQQDVESALAHLEASTAA